MTNYVLPHLKQTPSSNFSDRVPSKIDLIVVHDCEGSYEGSIAWFCTPKSQVSAHLVLNGAGDECTQLVPFAKKAWHACAYNSRSIGVEMAGYSKTGFPATELNADAAIVAWLLWHNSIPCRWAEKGDGPGFCSHYDLGMAGGGHSDPTTVLAVWNGFIQRVKDAYAFFGGPVPWPVGVSAPPPPMPVGFRPSGDIRRDDAPTPSISPWPALSADPSFFQNGALAIKTLRSLGCPDIQAFGLLAQPEGECSLNQKIWTAVNYEANGARAGGICMWHNDRRDMILEYAKIDVWSETDLAKQIEAMWSELANAEHLAFTKIMATTTVYDAGAAACQYFERAGAAEAIQRRGLMAMRWENFFQVHPEMLS